MAYIAVGTVIGFGIAGYRLLNKVQLLVEAESATVRETRLAAQAPVMLDRLTRIIREGADFGTRAS